MGSSSFGSASLKSGLLLCGLSLIAACSKSPPANVAATADSNQPTATPKMPGPPPQNLLAQADGAKPATGKPAAAKPADTLVGEVVTSGEYYDAAKAIEAAIQEADTAKFSAFFDMGAMADKALAGVDVNEQFKKGFKQGAANLTGDASLTGQIVNAVRNGGSYTLLRVHKSGDKHSALFRMSAGGGLNYHDLKFAKGTDGKIKVDDLFVLLTGELMSTTFRQMVLPVAASQNRNLLQKLAQKESDFVTHFPKVQELAQATRTKDFTKAMEIYRSMPKSLQETKAVLIARLTVATQTQNWDETRATTADYRRLYPADGTADLLSLDALVLEKKYDEALAAVDRIDKLVGGDPELNKFRENIATLKAQK
jgi:hypothetical protein